MTIPHEIKNALNLIGDLNSLPVIILFYAVPLISVLPITSPRRLSGVNKFIGALDRIICPLRFIFNFVLLSSATFILINNQYERNIIFGSAAALLVAADVFHIFRRRKRKMGIVKLLKESAAPSPKELIKLLNACFGPMHPNLPNALTEIKLENLDFRARKFYSKHAWLYGINRTIRITRFALLVNRKLGTKELQAIALPLSAAWGTSVISATCSAVRFKNVQNLTEASGKTVYMFTHGSFLDFAIAPLLVAYKKQLGLHAQLPNFFVAANHFKINPIFRWLLGIGQVAHALGMIFVSRKGSVDDAKAATSAAEYSLASGRDVSIFPQGTRAYGRNDRTGVRMEAGYYSVGSRDRISVHGRHIKKGSAHLGHSLTSKQIAVSFLPVSIRGASIVCPKGTTRIMPGNVIEVVIGEPVLTKKMAGKTVEEWQREIDLSLQRTSNINSYLERWFLEDMRRLLPPYELEELSLSLKPWREKDGFLHGLLDVIYSLQNQKRLPMLSETAHMLIENADASAFKELRKKAANSI